MLYYEWGKYMKQIPKMNREELLCLPISIKGWIILRDYISWYADLEMYKKIVADYRHDCPLFELEKILNSARVSLDEKEFLDLLEFLFGQHHGDLARNNVDSLDADERYLL